MAIQRNNKAYEAEHRKWLPVLMVSCIHSEYGNAFVGRAEMVAFYILQTFDL